jgi:hypothetical protein
VTTSSAIANLRFPGPRSIVAEDKRNMARSSPDRAVVERQWKHAETPWLGRTEPVRGRTPPAPTVRSIRPTPTRKGRADASPDDR